MRVPGRGLQRVAREAGGKNTPTRVAQKLLRTNLATLFHSPDRPAPGRTQPQAGKMRRVRKKSTDPPAPPCLSVTAQPSGAMGISPSCAPLPHGSLHRAWTCSLLGQHRPGSAGAGKGPASGTCRQGPTGLSNGAGVIRGPAGIRDRETEPGTLPSLHVGTGQGQAGQGLGEAGPEGSRMGWCCWGWKPRICFSPHPCVSPQGSFGLSPAPAPGLDSAILTGDFSRPCSLPLEDGQHRDLRYVSPDTVASLLRGRFAGLVEEYVVVDCRYPYEYAGGHIKGALNVYGEEQLAKLFLPDPLGTALCPRGSVLIFHCEFSSERGPRLCRSLRRMDRDANRYPELWYPELYVLSGGYREFYQHFQGLCEPQGYVHMRHKDFRAELRNYQRRRQPWSLRRIRKELFKPLALKQTPVPRDSPPTATQSPFLTHSEAPTNPSPRL